MRYPSQMHNQELPEPYERKFQELDRCLKLAKKRSAQPSQTQESRLALLRFESRLEEVKSFRKMPRRDGLMTSHHIENLRQARQQCAKLKAMQSEESG